MLAGFKKGCTFATLSTERGRLAQLVQSICLTSRGSGVRIPQRPRAKRSRNPKGFAVIFFVANRTPGPRPLWGQENSCKRGQSHAGVSYVKCSRIWRSSNYPQDNFRGIRQCSLRSRHRAQPGGRSP